MIRNGTCTVLAGTKSVLLNVASVLLNVAPVLLNVASTGIFSDLNFTVGRNTMTKEPLSIVTRSNDAEFSDVVNWVVHALHFGEEQRIARNSSLCRSYMNASDIDFLNAVYCVGNYEKIYNTSLHQLENS